MENVQNPRLNPIRWLAVETGATVDVEELEHLEERSRIIKNNYGILPTIGCEIEVKWSSLFPDIAHEYFGEKNSLGDFAIRYSDLSIERQEEIDDRCRLLDAETKPLYERTVDIGIPSGDDAYWEFANSPTYHWKTLATEVSLLYAHELIPEDYDHSLHVTLGGASPKGGGMSFVLSALELLHVSGDRIEQATYPNKYGNRTAWARRGSDGLRQKSGSYLSLSEDIATELRTLTSSRPESTQTVLKDAQFLTASLLAFRKRNAQSNTTMKELSTVWPDLTKTVKSLWQERDLPIESWGMPHINSDVWLNWAECLRRKTSQSTLEWHVAERLKTLIDKTQLLIDELE